MQTRRAIIKSMNNFNNDRLLKYFKKELHIWLMEVMELGSQQIIE